MTHLHVQKLFFFNTLSDIQTITFKEQIFAVIYTAVVYFLNKKNSSLTEILFTHKYNVDVLFIILHLGW